MRWTTRSLFLILILVGIEAASAGQLLALKAGAAPQFTYAGGTANLEAGCKGQLELTSTSMTFQCPDGVVTIPFASVSQMEYRPSVSRRIEKLKLDWKSKPSGSGGKNNLFFSVVYRSLDRVQAIVLKVAPKDMRPYLAEIELSSGKRIRVSDYRGFD